jgi:hypothetical protein
VYIALSLTKKYCKRTNVRLDYQKLPEYKPTAGASYQINQLEIEKAISLFGAKKSIGRRAVD